MKKMGKSEVIIGALITAVAGIIVALIQFGPWSHRSPTPDPSPQLVPAPEPPPTSSPAVPAPEPDVSIPAEYRETRVSLRVLEQPLRPVLVDCAKQAGLELGLDETLEGKRITIQVENGLLSSVMREICDAIDCRWEIVSRPVPLLLVTPRQSALPPAAATSPAAEPSSPPG